MLPRCLGVVSAFPFLVQNFLLMQARNHALRPIIAVHSLLFNTHSTALLLAVSRHIPGKDPVVPVHPMPPSIRWWVCRRRHPPCGGTFRADIFRPVPRTRASAAGSRAGMRPCQMRSADASWSFLSGSSRRTSPLPVDSGPLAPGATRVMPSDPRSATQRPTGRASA